MLGPLAWLALGLQATPKPDPDPTAAAAPTDSPPKLPKDHRGAVLPEAVPALLHVLRCTADPTHDAAAFPAVQEAAYFRALVDPAAQARAHWRRLRGCVRAAVRLAAPSGAGPGRPPEAVVPLGERADRVALAHGMVLTLIKTVGSSGAVLNVCLRPEVVQAAVRTLTPPAPAPGPSP